ncbi:MAG: tryptophan synthase subunit alpha [Bacteroidetes bacterium]|nr:tryptophan synthase subunit alpha [Bacteroidota bacterium]MCH8524140.1 tryptophan synthase subunit alpha [Balneolales bacterium]
MPSERIHTVFKNSKDKSVMAMFITAGYPEPVVTADLVLALEESGADIIELGMPFSDPLADGPTIQYSSEVAIEKGTDLDMIFSMVREIRQSSQIPIVLMGYINPILHYGVDEFFSKAAESGVDGFILPDVPVEETGLVEEHCTKYDMSLIHLVAPNTTDSRMKLIDSKSNGFVYCVSVTGVTGARDGDQVAQSVDKFIGRVKANITKNPVLVGFGIRTHTDAMRVSSGLSGFVVGSALIDTIRKNYPNSDWLDQVKLFVKTIKYGSQN